MLEFKSSKQNDTEMTDVLLDSETGDRIALSVLKHHLFITETMMKKHTEDGTWIHDDDKLFMSNELIPSLRILIDYFGG